MTAYIKMIDVWMIFTMFYPFCVVTLYSLLQFLRAKELDIPVMLALNKSGGRNTKISLMRIVTFLLDFGLPLLVTIFIIIFLVLGFTNTAAAEGSKSC